MISDIFFLGGKREENGINRGIYFAVFLFASFPNNTYL